jgi:hypothetical protein
MAYGTYKGKSLRPGGGGRFQRMVDRLKARGYSEKRARAIAAASWAPQIRQQADGAVGCGRGAGAGVGSDWRCSNGWQIKSALAALASLFCLGCSAAGMRAGSGACCMLIALDVAAGLARAFVEKSS